LAVEARNIFKSKFFEEADIPFWLWDKDLNLIDVNETSLKTFRFKREDIIGKNLSEISPDSQSSGRYDLYLEVMRTGKTLTIDEVESAPGLGNFYFRLKAFKVGDGLGSVATNITYLKENIEELETFIYKSAHDMRAPVASILGLLNLTETEVKDLEEAKRFLNIIKQQTKNLDSILQKLIETTRIRKNEKVIQLIDFDTIIEEVLASLAYINGFKEIKFGKKVMVKNDFYSDKFLVVSIFQNIIDNAIKYKNLNSGTSFINITITDEAGGVKIDIADNGIGIPADLQKDIFKMFFRATDQARGSGLGLYTVNHTVKKLGGYINLNSEQGTGTTFTIYLSNEKTQNS